jgi:subtilase family serine protease
LKRIAGILSLLIIAVLVGVGATTKTLASPSHASTAKHSHVCPGVIVGYARCQAIRVDVGPASGSPSGYNPADLQSAYKLPSATAGSGQTVAIVDAYDDPKAESDLGKYRSQFGLSACTTANGCFRKVDQTGGTSYPRGNRSWAQEISLDLDMVSAICPNCHILLVEATTNSFSNLATAVDEAAKLGANEISNSYGGSEYSNEVTDQSHYNHPGIAITVSSGDSGYGVQFPAASQYVTAVGGTTLNKANNSRGWSETVWSGAGSGCSAYIPKPSWQTDSGCSRRTVADVAADADPNTGVSVYDTYHQTGWLVFGGTSVASPIIASVYALAGNAGSVTYGSYSYSHTGSLFDVTSGSNGSCGGSYLCTGEVGYDGPTGHGTPDGSGGF